MSGLDTDAWFDGGIDRRPPAEDDEEPVGFEPWEDQEHDYHAPASTAPA